MKEINGVMFEEKRRVLTFHEVTACLGTPWGHYKDLWDAYNRPSKAKIGIYEEWSNWFLELNLLKCVRECKWWISSRNTFGFSITGYVIYENGTAQAFYITRDHNRMYKMEV